jgi:hypothetical protein
MFGHQCCQMDLRPLRNQSSRQSLGLKNIYRFQKTIDPAYFNEGEYEKFRQKQVFDLIIDQFLNKLI